MQRLGGRLAIPSLVAILATGLLGTPAASAEEPRAAEPIAPAALAANQLQLKLIASGFSSPIGVTSAGDGSGRLFIVQRRGLVRVVVNGAVQAGSFMDITGKVSQSGSERGFLGLAFDPAFESNRRLFVYYTQPDGDIVIARYLADPGLATVDEGSETILLEIEHSAYSNHNGGSLAFGPDGYLYAGTGDGGGGGDPLDNGQDTGELLGKLLRLDVSGSGYTNPPDNPFVGSAGLDQIWDYGLRNPWRFSFDRETDELWIADVGQDIWEEVNRESPASPGGLNYGWNEMEGMHCFQAGCSTAGKTLPIAEYDHDLGCSVTGGYVYRGSTQLDLVGLYVLADYCSGRVWTIPASGTALTLRLDTSLNMTSFGESESGELYAVDIAGGRLYRVVAPEFTDILASSFLDDIHWLFYEGLTTGCGGGRFCPTAAVTRGEMASFLARALDLPSTATDYFTDDEASIFEPDINRIAAAGLTIGCGGTSYCPDVNVRRAEMATFLAKALDLPPTATDFFADDETTSHEPNINALAAAGLTSGCGGGNFCPGAHVTREQMAAFLHRAFE